jgi:hypothetical protein
MGPGPLLLPVAWQPGTLQVACITGFTSVAKDLATVLQSNELPPPLSLSLLQEAAIKTVRVKIVRMDKNLVIALGFAGESLFSR